MNGKRNACEICGDPGKFACVQKHGNFIVLCEKCLDVYDDAEIEFVETVRFDG